MCTISWRCTLDAYQVFFNRDEQKSRSIALPPGIFSYPSKIDAVFPVDSQGGGSWVSVNNVGITLALLNFYQGRRVQGEFFSRGQILKTAAGLRTFGEIERFIRGLDLHCYQPFSLLVFMKGRAGPSMFRWDGWKLTLNEVIQSPLISSAFDFDGVSRSRLREYKKIVEKGVVTDEALNRFHRSHSPEKSAYSTCMHRDDAHTVSFSRVEVGDQVNFEYCPGAPCSVSESDYVRITLDLLTKEKNGVYFKE